MVNTIKALDRSQKMPTMLVI